MSHINGSVVEQPDYELGRVLSGGKRVPAAALFAPRVHASTPNSVVLNAQARIPSASLSVI